MSGVILGSLILHDFSLFASLESIGLLFISLLREAWILQTLLFVIFAGAIMALIEKSGGVGGFVEFVLHRSKIVKSERSALMLSYILGVIIFVETSITALVSGAVGKPLCDKYKIPHAKLAYVCDSTAAPIGSLIMINGYGALLLGLITTQIDANSMGINATETLIRAIGYNFYALSALLLAFVFIYFRFEIGAMKKSRYSTHSQLKEGAVGKSMYLMILPVILMVVLLFVFLFVSGGGDILKGDGSLSIFLTMLATLVFLFFYYLLSGNMTLSLWGKSAYSGAKSFVPISFILIFAFALGNITTELKTGLYLASFASENITVYFLAGFIFLLSSIISFATGTSWGTFSIMIPIAIPMALGMDANIALVIGAVISGGIFGDHCSPISDTTIISSMAADCEVIEHVKTQLPYALIGAFIAFMLFIVFSFLELF